MAEFARTYFPDYVPKESTKFHDEWEKTRSIKNELVLVTAFRGAGKSTFFTLNGPAGGVNNGFARRKKHDFRRRDGCRRGGRHRRIRGGRRGFDTSIPSNGIMTFTDKEDVEDKIGDGLLRDLIESALSIAKTTVYAVALQGSIAGTASAISPRAANAGTGTVSVSGSPRNEYDVRVDVVSGGSLNEGTFRVTVDGNAGKVVTIPYGVARYEIPGTGITLQFTPGESGFAEGDSFAFKTATPQATNGEVLAGVNAILEAKKLIEWIAVAGISNAALWAALVAAAEGAEAVYQYLFFVAQARGKAEGEPVDEYVNALTGAERGVATSTRLQVVAAWIEEAAPCALT